MSAHQLHINKLAMGRNAKFTKTFVQNLFILCYVVFIFTTQYGDSPDDFTNEQIDIANKRLQQNHRVTKGKCNNVCHGVNEKFQRLYSNHTKHYLIIKKQVLKKLTFDMCYIRQTMLLPTCTAYLHDESRITHMEQSDASDDTNCVQWVTLRC